MGLICSALGWGSREGAPPKKLLVAEGAPCPGESHPSFRFPLESLIPLAQICSQRKRKGLGRAGSAPGQQRGTSWTHPTRGGDGGQRGSCLDSGEREEAAVGACLIRPQTGPLPRAGDRATPCPGPSRELSVPVCPVLSRVDKELMDEESETAEPDRRHRPAINSA